MQNFLTEVHEKKPVTRHHLIMPDLGLPEITATLSLWLVDRGALVTEGDRLVEVLAGPVTVDLPAPVSGRIVEQLVLEDEPLVTGQAIAVIEEI